MKYIYYYTFEPFQNEGLAKIGETKNLKDRKSGLSSGTPKETYMIDIEVDDDISDHDVHRYMKNIMHIKQEKGEWFKCNETQFKLAVNNVSLEYNSSSSLITSVQLRLYKNKLAEKGQTTTEYGMVNVLKFFGINDKYKNLLGKKVKLYLTNGHSLIFSLNKNRCYCGTSINKEYFPKDHEKLHVVNAEFYIKSKNLF